MNYQRTKDPLASCFIDIAHHQSYVFLPNVLAIHIGTNKRIPHEGLNTSPQAYISAIPAVFLTFLSQASHRYFYRIATPLNIFSICIDNETKMWYNIRLHPLD